MARPDPILSKREVLFQSIADVDNWNNYIMRSNAQVEQKSPCLPFFRWLGLTQTDFCKNNFGQDVIQAKTTLDRHIQEYSQPIEGTELNARQRTSLIERMHASFNRLVDHVNDKRRQAGRPLLADFMKFTKPVHFMSASSLSQSKAQ